MKGNLTMLVIYHCLVGKNNCQITAAFDTYFPFSLLPPSPYTIFHEMKKNHSRWKIDFKTIPLVYHHIFSSQNQFCAFGYGFNFSHSGFFHKSQVSQVIFFPSSSWEQNFRVYDFKFPVWFFRMWIHFHDFIQYFWIKWNSIDSTKTTTGISMLILKLSAVWKTCEYGVFSNLKQIRRSMEYLFSRSK